MFTYFQYDTIKRGCTYMYKSVSSLFPVYVYVCRLHILWNCAPISSLQAGDVIKVTKQNENGMWEGELNNRKGHFPFKLVEVVDSANHQWPLTPDSAHFGRATITVHTCIYFCLVYSFVRCTRQFLHFFYKLHMHNKYSYVTSFAMCKDGITVVHFMHCYMSMLIFVLFLIHFQSY